MGVRNFSELVARRWNEGNFLCVGLDPVIRKIPKEFQKVGVEDTLFAFNRHIVDEVREYASAYKPNSAFYEQYGVEGISALRKTIAYIQETYADIPVILDAKRADIGNTNAGYAAFAFEYLRADGLTVHPYMGGESLKEFFDNQDKGIFVMCRNSNHGAGEFQDLQIDGEPLYLHLARSFADRWNYNRNCALVVGATVPQEIKKIRGVAPHIPFLIPGVGAQGGDLEESVRNGKDESGKGFVLAVSRAVIYADSPQVAAKELHGAIAKAL